MDLPTTSEQWRLLQTPPLSGARNMAIDAALAELYAQTQQPTLRFYRWSPPCLSLGLAQRLERDVDQAACAAHGIEVVRRQTGGRAILHDHEVTYSLVIAADHPRLGGTSVVESYRAISNVLCAGLARLGIVPELAPRPSPRAAKSAACFDLPGDYEITLHGRKLVGSAQARQQGIVLQHGSILLHADVEALTAVLRLPPALQHNELAQRLVALDEVVQPAPTFETVATAIVRGFEQVWGITFVEGPLTSAEERRADTLLREKFGNPTWTARR